MSAITNIKGYLTYCSYCYQRETHPEVEWQKWEPIFGRRTPELEARYLVENTGGAGVAFRLCEGCEGTFLYAPETGESTIWFLDGCWYCAECYDQAKVGDLSERGIA